MTSIQLEQNFIIRKYKRKLSLIKHQLLRSYPNFKIYFVIFIFILTILVVSNAGFFIASINRLFRSADGKIDWHDWQLIDEDEHRTGLGEHGEAAHLPFYPDSTKEINDTHGFNGYLGDAIALNRSLKDLRPPECKYERHSAELPSVSVIVIFHNEHLSTLLRTVYSVWNRTPAKLLTEIVLVDDASTIEDLHDDLIKYITTYMRIVTLVRVNERSGLIKAREIGAKVARGEVLVFLDAHCEAYHNWLPPLLDPMVTDYRTVMLPTIDVIAHDTYELRRQTHPSGFAGRGGFNWYFKYKLMPLLPETIANPAKPFETPIMAGGLFAIWAKFFAELGGYDDGLNTYGGEQFEISFKIWQCGGRMLESACSRFGHIYRYRPISVNLHINYDFVSTNYKRVAEVWMDEYKKYLYMRQPHLYSKLDAGDLSKQKALRKRLRCRSFKWFMENVAFDLAKYHPLDEPSFAYGGIKNLGTNLCADTMSENGIAPVGVYPCAEHLDYPYLTQTFSLTLKHEIRERFEQRCWSIAFGQAVWFFPCELDDRIPNDKMLWRYDTVHKWIINKADGLCLDVNGNKEVILSRCIPNNINQMWQFGIMNHTAFQSGRDWE